VATLVRTGIKIIDNLLGGGFERGASVILRASPFVDATPVIYEWLFNRLTEGDKAIYLVNNRSPEMVLEEMSNYGWPVEPYRENGSFDFIDAYSGALSMKSEETYFIKDPLDAQEIDGTVLGAFEAKGKGSIAIFDSLNTLIDQCGARILSAVEGWCRYGLTCGVSSLYSYTEWGYPEEVKSRIEKTFDTVIDFRDLKRIVASEVLTASKVCGKLVMEKRFTSFKYVKPGGLRAYVPKVLVTGPYHAGKTTVVHALSTRAVSVQRMGTTVALDFGHVDYGGFSVDLFGTVGQPRFDPILDILGAEALGVLLVVDSTKPEEFPRAMEMMRKSGVHGLPYIVVANKQDLPGALSAEQVRERMYIPKDIPVVEVVATEKKNLLEALDALLRKLIGEE